MAMTVIDRVTLPAGLALQFIDAASGQPVLDGLQCPLCRLSDGAVVAPSVSGPGGVCHWPALPPRWAAGNPPPAGSPPRAELRLQDTLGRFLPLRLAWPPVAGLGNPPVVPAIVLCSAPARPAPPGTASVQALLLGVDDHPAAWARVRVVDSAGQTTPGMSDDAGRLLLHLPFPQPDRRPAGSPPLATDAWPVATVSLHVQHDPALTPGPAARLGPRLAAWLSQPEVRALAQAGAADALPPVRVEAGHVAVLRTAGLPPPHSELRLVPR